MVRRHAAFIAGVGSLCSALGLSPVCQASLAAVAVSTQEPPAVTSSRISGVWTDRIIAKCRPGIRLDDLVAAQEEPRLDASRKQWRILGIRPAVEIPPRHIEAAARAGLDRFIIIEVPRGTDTPRLAAELATLSDLFELAETDPVGVLHADPSDPGLSQQWALSNGGQTIAGIAGRNDADIDWLEVWNQSRVVAPVIVALLDTGLSTSHPDLAGRSVPGRCFVCGSGDPDNTDDGLTLSHGTLCAGIIAANSNNGMGVCGISRAAQLMPLKVTTGLIASQTSTGNALIWATDNGAQIASMSWGFGATANVSFLRSAVEYAHDQGVLMVASTGNTPGAAIGYPARWSEVIAVGATNNRDEIFPGATTGDEMDISAPGQDILTTVDQNNLPDGYTLASGTSMAVPMVAAAAAELWGMKPLLTADDIRRILESTADDLGPTGPDASFGAGRLNLNSAVQHLLRGGPGCTGDYDGDHYVGLADLFSFLIDYFAGDAPGSRADMDRNGVVNVQDLFTFMQAWFAGC